VGGFGSGRYQAWRAARALESVPRLDVLELVRSARGQRQWAGGSVRVEAGLDFGRAERATLAIGGRGEVTSVALESQPCRFGGVRWWARCPNCSRRCAVLSWLGRWGCRVCLGLVHATRQCSKLNRLAHRAERIHARLRSGAEWGLFGGASKPRFMHERTYDRLLAELDDLRARDQAEFARRFGR